MDGLAGYGSEDSENSSKSSRIKTMNKHQKPTDAEQQSEKNSAQLEAEWESFQAMISSEPVPAAAPVKAKDDGSSSESDSEDETMKKKKRRDSTSSSGSSDKSNKSDKSGSESGSSDDSSDEDSADEKKKKKEAGSAVDEKVSRSPQSSTAKRKSRSPSSSSESETEKKPAPSLTAAGQPNGTQHTESIPKERKSSHHSPSPKRRRSKSRSKSPSHRRSSQDHRSRSHERKRRRRPRRSRSRGRRSRSRDRRPRRPSRSREKSSHDKQDDKNNRSRSRSLTRKRRSRSRSPKRRRRPRSGSRSRRRPRSRSGSPHRVLRRRRRRRRRRKRRPSGRISRSRSRSRSPAPLKKKRNEPLNYKEKLKQSLLQVQKQAAEGKLNMDELTANSKDLISPNEKPSNLPLGTNNPLVAMATGQLGHVTPQQALLQTMAAMHQKAQELTGVAVPKYYNPASVNPLKYAEQVQKRKLLWGKNKKAEAKPEAAEETPTPAAAPKTQWDGQLFQQDQDGKQTAKFRKLMGMKVSDGSGECSGATGNTGSASSEENANLKKHQEMFSRLDQEYEFARMATHTHRGIGLGFTSMHHQYSSNK